MAYSYTAFTGNGSTTQYAVSFPYIRREHVAVTVAGVPSTFTWVNNSLIQMDAAPANGAAVRVYRTTPISAPLVDFADGATLVAADLDTNSRQSIYIQQELDDAQTDNLPNVIPNGDKGDITTSVGGTVWAINTGAVTSDKIANGAIVNADVNASAGIVATKLSFTQAGTGATARTVDSKLKDVVSVEDFGAVGDGVTNDYAALQAAFTYSALTKKPIFLNDKRYYTASTLQVGNAIIRSLGTNPGSADPYYLSKPDGTFVLGSANVSYYMNYGSGLTVTWATMIAQTAYGCCIVSDYNGTILEASQGTRINISGIAIIGDHKKSLQKGLATAVPASYLGAYHTTISNLNIIGCGGAGMSFSAGVENTIFDNIKVLFCNSTGVNIDVTVGVDSPTDNITFKGCQFAFNRLSGIYFSKLRKHLLIQDCDFSGNNQYQDGQQPGGSYVDPVLGHDRTPVANVANMPAGVWINDADSANGGYIFNVNITDCTGELVSKGLHFRAQTSVGELQHVTVNNTSFFRTPQLPYSGGNNGAFIFFDVKGLRQTNINATNYSQSLDYIKFESNTVPAGNNSFYAPYWTAPTIALQSFATYAPLIATRTRAPTFTASISSSQSITSGVTTKVLFQTEQFDSDSCFDTTLGRFTPNVAGWYNINACISFTAAYTSQYMLPIIYVNGTATKEGNPNSGTASLARPQVNAMVYCNGTTDYVEIYLFQNSGIAVSTGTGTAVSYCNGTLVTAL